MRAELTFWDHITLSLALLFVIVFTIIKLKHLFSASSGGCGNCSSAAACSAPLTKKRLENQVEVQMVSVSSLKEEQNCFKSKSER